MADVLSSVWVYLCGFVGVDFVAARGNKELGEDSRRQCMEIGLWRTPMKRRGQLVASLQRRGCARLSCERDTRSLYSELHVWISDPIC